MSPVSECPPRLQSTSLVPSFFPSPEEPVPNSSSSPDQPSLNHSSSLEYHTANHTLESTPSKHSYNGRTLGLFEDEPTSPRRSVDHTHADARHLHSSQTPGSLSQFSDRTIECAEAEAVNLYQHGNNSLVVVQHLSSKLRKKVRALDTTKRGPPSIVDEVSTPTTTSGNDDQGDLRPIFRTTLEESSPMMSPCDPPYQSHKGEDNISDSPLTHPRIAPMPPVVIIPPTPSPRPHLSASDASNRNGTRPDMPRRPSLVERARRYSESFIQPFLQTRASSTTRKRHSTGNGIEDSDSRPTSVDERNRTLHPFWRPRGFWDDFTSDDEEDDLTFYDEGLEDEDRLPPGGDTSDVESLHRTSKNAWPRKMSVRMPGFMSQGAFLQGNSLGIDRHGSNSRRHYVSPRGGGAPADESVKNVGYRRALSLPFFTSPALRKRRSRNRLRDFAWSTDSQRQRSIHQHPNQRRKESGVSAWVTRYRSRGFGIGDIREKISQRKLEREERKREIRRRLLKGSISRPIGERTV